MPGLTTLEKTLGKRLRRAREALEYTTRDFSAHLGITQKYLIAIEKGLIRCSPEVATRAVMWIWEGYDWRKHPSLPALLSSHRKQGRTGSHARLKVVWPKNHKSYAENYAKLCRAAKELGVSKQAIVMLAIERMTEDYPTMYSLREGAKAYEKLRIDTVSEWFPEIVPLLEGDVAVAKPLHRAMKVSKQSRRPVIEPLSVLDAWSDSFDGPATPVAPWPPRLWKKE